MQKNYKEHNKNQPNKDKLYVKCHFISTFIYKPD